ncbi:ATP-binding protein [Streptomyces armeniacus]|uniref:ATP-binding protein n=1 Tax=Streptomyces armeniacus TaxID=83291 RepID=A0A345XRC2_9ACTN|nr:ATP-binding protein [Streptomyces armeniacus]AXK34188.1 ATP-binding protein [Streptomyces armeniacus]
MEEGPLPYPPRQYRIALTVGDHSPRHLRRIARAYLHLWELDPLADAVELALTELTTNVYRHTRDRWCDATLLRTDAGIRIEVYDRCPLVPPLRPGPRPSDELSENGRGLPLLALLSDKWGVDLHAVGKTVWCELNAAA